MITQDGFSILNDIELIDENMDKCLQAMEVLGERKALAEAEYYRVKADAARCMKDEGLAMTYITNTLKGQRGVNEKLKAFHSAEMSYSNAKEALLVNKQRYKHKTELFKLEYGKE